MELNIQAIADAKIQEMHESGKITAAIEAGIESLILKAVDSALNGYALKSDIEKQISGSISSVVNDIGFSAYNGFIAQKVKEITEGVMREDVAQKIQRVFSDMLIIKHDGIKLSEIVNAYRQYLFESVDEGDKWERRNFTCEVDEREDGSFTTYTIRLNEEEIDSRETAEIEFKIMRYRENIADRIYSLRFNGVSQKETFELGRLNKIESLLLNLYFNETPIIIDIDDVDDSNYYDIDD